MKRIRINGEIFWAPDEVESGVPITFRRVDCLDGIPVIELVETNENVPQFSFGPGNTDDRGRDFSMDGSKYNEMIRNQPQVEDDRLIGKLPKYPNGDDVFASHRHAQSSGTWDPDDIEFPENLNVPTGKDSDIPWEEAEVDDCKEVDGLLLLTIGGKSYLVIYDDECRRAGMGPGARISYRIMPQRSAVAPGIGKMGIDQIQLGNVLIPAGIGDN